MSKHGWPIRIARGLAIFIVFTLVLSALVMVIWNALIPDLFHGPVLGYWQALGLLVLAHILFRSHGPWRHAGGWGHERWRKRFEDKLAAMPPEDRERIREEWRRRCGWAPEAGTAKGEEHKA